MEILALLLVFALFLLPPMLMMRSQRKRAAEVQQMQASIAAGEKVVTVSGLHGTVVANHGETLELEIAPGVVITLEVAGVMKKVDPVAPAPAAPAEPAVPPTEAEEYREDPRP